jgi:hypothetical protein
MLVFNMDVRSIVFLTGNMKNLSTGLAKSPRNTKNLPTILAKSTGNMKNLSTGLAKSVGNVKNLSTVLAKLPSELCIVSRMHWAKSNASALPASTDTCF